MPTSHFLTVWFGFVTPLWMSAMIVCFDCSNACWSQQHHISHAECVRYLIREVLWDGKLCGKGNSSNVFITWRVVGMRVPIPCVGWYCGGWALLAAVVLWWAVSAAERGAAVAGFFLTMYAMGNWLTPVTTTLTSVFFWSCVTSYLA